MTGWKPSYEGKQSCQVRQVVHSRDKMTQLVESAICLSVIEVAVPFVKDTAMSRSSSPLRFPSR